jgi:hypothetical protein
MKFEVISSNGRCMQSTEYAECVPYDMLEGLASHGYKFRVDGKIIPKSRVKSAIDVSLGKLSTNIEDIKIVSVDIAKGEDKVGNADLVARSSSVTCIEDGLTFKSQSEAAKYYDISAMSVSKAVKTGKPVKGHTFKRA